MPGGKRVSERNDKRQRAQRFADSGLTHVAIADAMQLSRDQVDRLLAGYQPKAHSNVAGRPYATGYRYGAGW